MVTPKDAKLSKEKSFGYLFRGIEPKIDKELIEKARASVYLNKQSGITEEFLDFVAAKYEEAGWKTKIESGSDQRENTSWHYLVIYS